MSIHPSIDIPREDNFHVLIFPRMIDRRGALKKLKAALPAYGFQFSEIQNVGEDVSLSALCYWPLSIGAAPYITPKAIYEAAGLEEAEA